MFRVNLDRKRFAIPFLGLVLMLTLPSLLLAQEEKKDTRPERAIAVYPEYSGADGPHH